MEFSDGGKNQDIEVMAMIRDENVASPLLTFDNEDALEMMEMGPSVLAPFGADLLLPVKRPAISMTSAAQRSVIAKRCRSFLLHKSNILDTIDLFLKVDLGAMTFHKSPAASCWLEKRSSLTPKINPSRQTHQ